MMELHWFVNEPENASTLSRKSSSQEENKSLTLQTSDISTSSTTRDHFPVTVSFE